MRKELAGRPSRAERAQARALGNLIAAAPDLLALATDIASVDPQLLAHSKRLLKTLREWQAAARTAIAKAEGK